MQPSDSTLQGLPVLGHVDRVDGSPTLPSPNPSTPPHPRHVAGGVIGSFPAWQGIGLLLGMYPPEGSLKLSSLRPFSCAFSQRPAAKAKMVRTPWPCLCLAALGGTEKDPESSHFPLHGGSWRGLRRSNIWEGYVGPAPWHHLPQDCLLAPPLAAARPTVTHMLLGGGV